MPKVYVTVEISYESGDIYTMNKEQQDALLKDHIMHYPRDYKKAKEELFPRDYLLAKADKALSFSVDDL